MFMPMIVDAALVTRKGKGADFNTGSINASGKTWQREKIHGDKGVFVTGRAENAPYYAVATSGVKGIAETATTLFNDFASVLGESVENRGDVLSSFFKTFAGFIKENADLEPSSFGMAVLSGKNDVVHIGLSGNASAYRFADGLLSFIKPDNEVYDDGTTQYGVAECVGVKENDIFLLLGEEISNEISAETVNKICTESDGDIQLILRRLAGASISSNPSDAVTLIAVKILAVEPSPVISAPAAAPVTAATDDAVDDAVAPVNSNENTPDAEESADGKKRTAGFIAVAAVLAVLVLLLGIIAIKGIIYYKGGDQSETTTAEESTTLVEESTTASEESTTAETESTTEEKTTAPETTTRRQSVERTTSRRQEERTTVRERHTEKVTEKATEPVTEKVTEKPTEAQTEKPTEPKTEPVTDVEKPTEVEKTTEKAPTE